MGIQLLHIVKASGRQVVVEALERCLETRGPLVIETAVLTRGMKETPVRIALNAIRSGGLPTGIGVAATPLPTEKARAA